MPWKTLKRLQFGTMSEELNFAVSVAERHCIMRGLICSVDPIKGKAELTLYVAAEPAWHLVIKGSIYSAPNLSII
jgi:hypothetical protein